MSDLFGEVVEEIRRREKEMFAQMYRRQLFWGWLFVALSMGLLIFSFWAADWSLQEMIWPRWVGPGFALVFALQSFLHARRWKKRLG